ncbi:hypothetical protein [Mycobacterium tuberculosis]|uniref:hypothetical protein n=1 Tax=Mycobacterium tuberculosis TaxID=1773 RepID=UPI0015A59647|nr:hypothetical protein [Mycobacterium tuberculosis]
MTAPLVSVDARPHDESPTLNLNRPRRHAWATTWLEFRRKDNPLGGREMIAKRVVAPG